MIFVGDMIWLPHPKSCTIQPAPLPEQLTNRMFTFVIRYDCGSGFHCSSKTVGDCIGQVLYENDFIDFVIEPKDVPKNSPIQLNTSDSNIRNILPNLYEKYPNHGTLLNCVLFMAGIMLNVEADKGPTLDVRAGSSPFNVLGSGFVDVILQNKTGTIPVFTLHLDLLFYADVSRTVETIHGIRSNWWDPISQERLSK